MDDSRILDFQQENCYFGGMDVDPNELIDTIVDALDYAELAHDELGLIKARRLLNNDLRQAIDQYVHAEISKAVEQQQTNRLSRTVFHQ